MSVDRLLARYLQTPAAELLTAELPAATLLAATLLCGFPIQAHADSDPPLAPRVTSYGSQ